MKKFFSYFKRTIALVLLACIVAGTVQPCFAAEEKIVKIAYIDNKDFIQMDETGKMVGYAVDYLDKISKYTGWKYVYIHMTMDEVLEGLLNGRADFFVPATRTHKRDELYEFSDLAVATECGILYAPRNSKIYYEDFSALNFQKIGIVKGTVAKMTLDIYAKKKNFNYTAVEYESEDELKKALDNEEIAAATGINFSTFDGYKAIGQYSCEDSYFMSSLDSKLMPQLNDALEQIKISDHTFEAELYNKYYLSGNAFKEPLFTRDENTYIRNSKVLKIGYRENTLPLSGTNKDGIPEGINIDLLQYVEKLSGLKFNLVPVQDMREGLDLIENDSLDLLLGINSRSIDFRRETVQVTEKILDYDVVCVGRKGGALSTGSNSTIALLTGVNGFNEQLRGMFKNCQFIYGKTSADCLDLV
ncbi:MAG: transporter substrate-binding domain-containing protein, partial [Oscillospiraceae bacterium]